MGVGRKITEKAFFVLAFVLLTAVGVARALGLSDNDILGTLVTAVIASAVSLFISFLVFRTEASG